MAELWLLLGKEDLASWARRVPAGAGPARQPGLRRRGTVAGTGCSCLRPRHCFPGGPGWGSDELHLGGLLN